ncbi:hypothetical protein AWZ03_000114 [Drosophila navojoa]|uniref:Uncharacterized protein n=1 Tax=Drosophila navojoa TaxID=7232 RepID=A0A484BWU6_DRONA|nr:uncharacterized protein LOC108651156 [Drosophila navojoa]TDG53299.1 hypothetical protein AWZ03_000114 [Drosophila navojoa]
MLFLTKSSSARRSLLALLLAVCFLSCALGAKIVKKVEKPPSNANDNKDKADTAAAEAAAAAEKPVSSSDDDDEETEDEDADEDDNEDEAEPEEEEENEDEQSADKEAAVATTSTTDKNQLKPAADPTDLSVWGMVRTLWNWLRSDLSESLFGDDDDGDNNKKEKPAVVEGRTFGKIRRLQMAMIPIIFKFGVLSAMVAFLVAIGMKSLFLLKVLIVMNALAILGKFLTLKTSLFGQYENSAPSFSYPGWNPHAKESWTPTGFSGSPPSGSHPPSKEIHLHIHGNAQPQAQSPSQTYTYESQGGWASRSDPYGAYQPTGQFTSDVPNNTDPMSLLPTKYPARNLIR